MFLVGGNASPIKESQQDICGQDLTICYRSCFSKVIGFFFLFFVKTTLKHYSEATVCFLNLFYDFHHAVILSSTVI